jgi:hypothetical protein
VIVACIELATTVIETPGGTVDALFSVVKGLYNGPFCFPLHALVDLHINPYDIVQ